MSVEKIHSGKVPHVNESMLSQDENFSRDWEYPRSIFTSDGNIMKLHDMKPLSEEVLLPVAVFPVCAERVELWKGIVRGLVSRGRRVLITDALHGIAYSRNSISLNDRATDVEYRKTAAVFAGMAAAHVEKVRGVGHSEGCIELLIAAASYPERFRDLCLIAPAGLMGKDTVSEFRQRQREDGTITKKLHDDPTYKFEIHPDDPQPTDIKGVALLNPTQTANEIRSIASIQTHDLLRIIKESGIGVVIVHSKDDVVIPFDRLMRTLNRQKRPGEDDLSGVVDDVIMYSGAHSLLFDLPATFADLVNGAFNALESKRNAREI